MVAVQGENEQSSALFPGIYGKTFKIRALHSGNVSFTLLLNRKKTNGLLQANTGVGVFQWDTGRVELSAGHG